MQLFSIKYLLHNKTIKAISSLKKERGGLYYLVFTGADDSSAKIYFTQDGNTYIVENYNEGDELLPLLEESDIIEVSYPNSRYKFKVYLSQVSNYSNETQLSQLFGVDLRENKSFDLKGFLSLFS